MEKTTAAERYSEDNLDQIHFGRRILRGKEASRVEFIQEEGVFGLGKEYYSFQVKCRYLPGENTFQVCADIQLPKCKTIEMYGELVDARTFKPLTEMREVTVNDTNCLSYLVTDELKIGARTIDDVLVIVNAGWVLEGEGTEEWASAVETLAKSPFIKDVVITHPQKQNGNPIVYPKNQHGLQAIKEGEYDLPDWMKKAERPGMLRSGKDTINIALFRTPDNRNDLDYLCMFGKSDGYHPDFMVPTEGSVSADSTTVQIKSATARCFLTDRGNKNGYYLVAANSEYGMSQGIETMVSGLKVSWRGLEKWDNAFMYSGNWQEHIFDYLMLLTIQYTPYEGAGIQTAQFAVTSSDQVQFEEGCYRKVLPISIMWGCLEENTLIIMGDGTERKIKEIRIGDLVTTETGVTRVTNVWKGREDQYLRICLGNKKLNVTGDHPILTKEGWKPAQEVTNSDEIKTVGGAYEAVTSVEEVKETIRVCNLSFERLDDRTLVAEGLIVGNFEAQNDPNLYSK